MTLREYKRDWMRRYRNQNPDIIRAAKKRHYIKHRKKIAAKKSEEWKANREYLQTRNSEYYRKNRERLLIQSKVYAESNKEKIQARIKLRIKNDIKFRFRTRMSQRIWAALKKGQKSARTVELLGCPIVWLEVHLESLFRPGMTWENYGPVWHVDHRRPCASFNLADPEQQKICFHWTNLQPLFAEENLRKGDKYVM